MILSWQSVLAHRVYFFFVGLPASEVSQLVGVALGGMAFGGVLGGVLGASVVLFLCWWRQRKGKAGSHVQEEGGGASPEDPTYEDVLPPREIQHDAMTIQLEANLAYDTATAHSRQHARN